MKRSSWHICSSSSDLHSYVLDLKGVTDKDYYRRHIRFDNELGRKLMPAFTAWDKSRNERLWNLGATMLKAVTGRWHGLAAFSFKALFSTENEQIVKNEAAKIGVSG